MSEAIVEETGQRRWWRPVLMFGVPLLLAAVGAYFYVTGGRYVSTDNAYVRQDLLSIAPDVSGRVSEVAVAENQQVAAGALLFRIEERPYRIALEEAEAAVANARLSVAQLRTGINASRAGIEGARAQVALEQQNFARQAELLKRGFTTRASYQASDNALKEARARLAAAEAEGARAQAAVAGSVGRPIDAHPEVMEAIAKRDKAALDLYRTTVRAPRSGIVSQTDRLQVGQVAAAGLPMVSLVGGQGIWIEANYKETDLANMAVGQPATIELDAYPDLELRGRVASIGAGTGSEFSVLPAQNASGNWVKVTQRVPVRIAIDGTPRRALLAGLSAEVTIDTRARAVASAGATPKAGEPATGPSLAMATAH
ncbi:HlyD family efflux transporter periplasmic adaptor subunit [Sphingoaurantiacus capsulatus]|uniref:HlyD family efflux transporter periplasmic adaptor subunit n=1 Tax=Sphingoaurantiacus capsulatus TaxID=1771310 RepID=A0ABV7X7K3_9SPHN